MSEKKDQRVKEARRGRAGLTFLELMIGMAITGVVAAAVGTLLAASIRGSDVNDDLRESLVIQQRATQMVSGIVRTSRQVLANGSNYVVLWTGDKQANGAPSLSELCRIEWDSTGQTLTLYRAPANLAPANDTPYTLVGTDFNAVTNGVKGSSLFPGLLLADQVTGWTMSYNNATPTLATMLYYQLTLTAGGVAKTTIGTAALRSQ